MTVGKKLIGNLVADHCTFDVLWCRSSAIWRRNEMSDIYDQVKSGILVLNAVLGPIRGMNRRLEL